MLPLYATAGTAQHRQCGRNNPNLSTRMYRTPMSGCLDLGKVIEQCL